MSSIIKLQTADQYKLERLQQENELLKATIDYLAMMTDVDVDNSTSANSNEDEENA